MPRIFAATSIRGAWLTLIWVAGAVPNTGQAAL
jgi:hypothetical protein